MQSFFCVVLGGWVFIKSGKGRKQGIFAAVWYWGQFHTRYGTLTETLFSIGQMGYPLKKSQLITNLKKNLVVF